MNYVIVNGKKHITDGKELNLIDEGIRDITEIQGLDSLTNLETLDLNNNKITEIKGLDSLTNLQHLDLSKNQIKEIEGLEKLTKLQYLFFDNNLIVEIKGLDSLINLEQLFLFGNPIKKDEKYLLEPTAQIEKSIIDGGAYDEDEESLMKKSAQEIVLYCRNKKQKKKTTEQEKEAPEKKNLEIEKEMLENLISLFQISDRVNINDVAEVLGLSRGKVVKKLIEWKKHFDVRVDGDFINIKPQDVNALMSLLDKSYQTWSSDPNKAQKKE